jgi:hypothetical protein
MAEQRQGEKSDVKVLEVVKESKTVDKKLVDESVAFIKRKLGETLLRGMVEIGEHVFEKFFEGKVENVTSKDPNKNASFSELANRCRKEMNVSKTTLNNALWTALAHRQLPERSSFKQLPPSYQTALLPLRKQDNFEKVEELAAKALEKELDRDRLRSMVDREVAKLPKDEKRPGRPPSPRIVKTLTGSLKLFTLESGRRSFTKADVEALSDEQARAAKKTAQELVTSLNRLIEQLGAKK